MSYYGDNGSIRVELWYQPFEAHGVTALVVAGALSFAAVVSLLVVMAISGYKSLRSPDEHLFVRTHVAAYFVSLLICDLAQATGSLMNAKWVLESGVRMSGFCTAQAAIKQAGNVGTALWSLVIATHTFSVLFMKWKIKDIICVATLVGVWSLLGMIVLVGPAAIATPERGPFFGLSGYWCWITPAYPAERYTLEYMFMFASAGLSFILYTLVFLRMRGNIYIDGWRIQLRWVSSKRAWYIGRDMVDTQLMTVTKQMLWYPVAYTILILPIAASRLSEFAGHKVPFSVIIFSGVIFMLSGFVNTVLFTTTRRVIPARSLLPNFALRRIGGHPNPTVSDPSATQTSVFSPAIITVLDEPIQARLPASEIDARFLSGSQSRDRTSQPRWSASSEALSSTGSNTPLTAR